MKRAIKKNIAYFFHLFNLLDGLLKYTFPNKQMVYPKQQ